MGNGECRVVTAERKGEFIFRVKPGGRTDRTGLTERELKVLDTLVHFLIIAVGRREKNI